jgi:S1-C subfamily serine protease
MMRENESDGDSAWAQPPGYAGPPAPREAAQGGDEPTLTHRHAASPPPPPPQQPQPQQDYPDTVAFGTPAGYGSQAGYGDQARYGHQDAYGNQGGYGNPGGYGSQAGSGWYTAGPGDPAGPGPGGGPGEPRGSGRTGRLLVYLLVAALAAGIGAGATVLVGGHHAATPQASGVSSGASSGVVPGPHDNAAGSGSRSAPLNPDTVAKKVDPGLVDIVASLKYNGETAEGTGMIISSRGLVLTNNHVIDQATSIRATLVTPGKNTAAQYTAKVLGYDATDDVALLQLVGASGLPVESFGNSSQVSLGTPVLALGNADGRGGAKPAVGIINALDRSIQASDEGSNTTENLKHMLQTNARIQQGDSGGALANNAGQVIGMITAANTGNPHGGGGNGGTLGFAIPINSALSIARQIAAGKPSATVYIGVPGFLGVSVADSNSDNPQLQAADAARGGSARRNGISCQTAGPQADVPAKVAPTAAGALIVSVICDSAASVAGMVPGDVITAVNGQPITTPDSLTGTTAKYHPNEIVSVQWVSLDGIERTTRMQLGQGPARLTLLI